MTTLKDKLNSAISEEVYRNTRTFATCKRFYRFTKYGSFAFSAREYNENGDFLNNVTIGMGSEDIINLYEDVPESELPLLLRSSQSQTKCTTPIELNAGHVGNEELEHKKPELLVMPNGPWNNGDDKGPYRLEHLDGPGQIPRGFPILDRSERKTQ